MMARSMGWSAVTAAAPCEHETARATRVAGSGSESQRRGRRRGVPFTRGVSRRGMQATDVGEARCGDRCTTCRMLGNGLIDVAGIADGELTAVAWIRSPPLPVVSESFRGVIRTPAGAGGWGRGSADACGGGGAACALCRRRPDGRGRGGRAPASGERVRALCRSALRAPARSPPGGGGPARGRRELARAGGGHGRHRAHGDRAGDPHLAQPGCGCGARRPHRRGSRAQPRDRRAPK